MPGDFETDAEELEYLRGEVRRLEIELSRAVALANEANKTIAKLRLAKKGLRK